MYVDITAPGSQPGPCPRSDYSCPFTGKDLGLCSITFTNDIGWYRRAFRDFADFWIEDEHTGFLKIPDSGSGSLEELVSYDPHLIVGILGAGADTTLDAFQPVHGVLQPTVDTVRAARARSSSRPSTLAAALSTWRISNRTNCQRGDSPQSSADRGIVPWPDGATDVDGYRSAGHRVLGPAITSWFAGAIPLAPAAQRAATFEFTRWPSSRGVRAEQLRQGCACIADGTAKGDVLVGSHDQALVVGETERVVPHAGGARDDHPRSANCSGR